jgi:hypothetical protein
MNEYTVSALIHLLKQFDPNANIVIDLDQNGDYEPIIDAQYNEHGDVEIVFQQFR